MGSHKVSNMSAEAVSSESVTGTGGCAFKRALLSPGWCNSVD